MQYLYKSCNTRITMMIKTDVKKQGNSTVIILPRRLGLRPSDKVSVLVVRESVSKVEDIAGLYKGKLQRIDASKKLKEVKEELWGE